MDIGCVLFMLFGLIVTWGGFGYSLYVQIKHEKSKNS